MAEEEERQRRVQDMETASGDAQTQHAVHDRMAVVEEELLHKVTDHTTFYFKLGSLLIWYRVATPSDKSCLM